MPNTNTVAWEDSGWGFDLNNRSNITFQSCNFIAADPGPGNGALRYQPPVSPFTVAANHITFTNCTFFDSQDFYLYPGEDCFSFLNCEFGRCSSGIYSLLNGQRFGPNRITVSHCYIHDTGTPEYNDGDAHGVGIQAGNFHTITHNTFSNTGPAIVLWTGNEDMKSNTIAYNFIENTHTNTSSGDSDGIAISGINALATAGYRIGNQIYGNIIVNCAIGNGSRWQGIGISCNSPDYTFIANNTIYGGNVGIDYEVAHTNYSVNALIENNIIVNTAKYYYYLVGSVAPTNLTADYNLYYPSASLSGNATIYPGTSHDAHSLFANPLFGSAAPTTTADFHLGRSSQAIGAGTPVGLLQDFSGTSIPSSRPPDIGAYEFNSSQAPSPPSDLHWMPVN